MYIWDTRQVPTHPPSCTRGKTPSIDTITCLRETPTIERDRKIVFTDEKLGDSCFIHEQSTNRRLKWSP